MLACLPAQHIACHTIPLASRTRLRGRRAARHELVRTSARIVYTGRRLRLAGGGVTCLQSSRSLPYPKRHYHAEVLSPVIPDGTCSRIAYMKQETYLLLRFRLEGTSECLQPLQSFGGRTSIRSVSLFAHYSFRIYVNTCFGGLLE